MSLRVFVAGATGVLGRALIPVLIERGHEVTALAHSRNRRTEPSVAASCAVVRADLLDPVALSEVLMAVKPDVVVHYASAFRAYGDPGWSRTATLWELGTRNLLDAAASAQCGRVIAQSTASAYVPLGDRVLDEEAPLWTDAPGCWGDAVRAAADMEERVFTCPDVEGVALRFGALYGPGTSFAAGGSVYGQVRGSALPLVEQAAGVTSFTHVEDAAAAVLAMLADGEPGAYNVVDNEPAESAEWLPAYARMIGGPEPVALTLEQARCQLDGATVHQLTDQRGATNFRIREAIGWRPAWPSWREGFARMFGFWPG